MKKREIKTSIPSKKNNKKAVEDFNSVLNSLNNDIINGNTNLEEKHFLNFHTTMNNIALTTPKCAHCNNCKDIKKCSICLSVYYCRRECQKNHWKEHKTVCVPITI